MKKNFFIICMMALAVTACRKPEPGINPDSNETTDTLVKKYLTKEYLGDTSCPVRIIDWNDDYSRINHITTFSSGNPNYQLDHDFEYYGDDSICVLVSKPQNAWGWPLFTKFTCHLESGKVSTIDYYRNSVLQSTDLFEYDEKGRMINRKTKGTDIELRYDWEGNNVVRIEDGLMGEIIGNYGDFCEHVYPDYTLPYCLFSGDGSYLMKPLWKNMYRTSYECLHDCDVDGYITRTYRVDDQGTEITLRIYVYSN